MRNMDCARARGFNALSRFLTANAYKSQIACNTVTTYDLLELEVICRVCVCNESPVECRLFSSVNWGDGDLSLLSNWVV